MQLKLLDIYWQFKMQYNELYLKLFYLCNFAYNMEN